MSIMILDAGNSIIKAKIARRKRGEIAFPHAIKPLTKAEYSSILAKAGSSGPPQDYLGISGQPYAVGASAERHGVQVQRIGAARYIRDYYGTFAEAALARLYERSMEISIFGSHPAGDTKFRDDLMKYVIGDKHAEVGEHERHFKVVYANTIDEPVGGLMNVFLTEDGLHYQRADISFRRNGS